METSAVPIKMCAGIVKIEISVIREKVDEKR